MSIKPTSDTDIANGQLTALRMATVMNAPPLGPGLREKIAVNNKNTTNSSTQLHFDYDYIPPVGHQRRPPLPSLTPTSSRIVPEKPHFKQ